MTGSVRAWVDELDALRAAGTDGPWGADRDLTGGYDLQRPDGDFITDRLGALSEDDAALIVAAVNNLDRLTAIVRGLTDLADELDAEAARHDAADPLNPDGLLSAINAARHCRRHAARIRAALNAEAEQ